MEKPEDLASWASRHKLSAETRGVLEENGFHSVEDLVALNPLDLKEAFQHSGLLNMAQYLALKRAMASLWNPQNPAYHPPPNPASHPHPLLPQPPLHSSPYASPPGPQPQTSPGYHPFPPPQSYPAQPPTPLPPQPYLSQPYPSHPQHPSLSYPHPQPLQPYPSQSRAQLNPATAHALSGSLYNGEQSWTPQGQSSWAGDGSEDRTMVTAGAHGGGEVTEWFRFLLLGKTGSGKSTTGNTIFGERLFDTAATFASVTSDCERKTNTGAGRKMEILDSPGLYDTHRSQEEVGVVIVQAVAGMHPGPHAILYVVRLGRYTAEEHGAYLRLKALFDSSIARYLIIVFTHGDMLERERRSIGDLVTGPNTPQNLQQVLRECNNRYVVFNNMAADPQPQVENLLRMVRRMGVENGGRPYSCPKYANIGQGMEAEVARRLQEVERRDLKRQKYVQELEKQTREAENKARQTQEQYQKNEEERQRRTQEEERRRTELEERLQNQIKEQQIGFEKYEQDLQRLHRDREEQERTLREKQSQMNDMERQRAEEQAEKMRQREAEMEAALERQKEQMEREKKEEGKKRERMERERQQFQEQMEEQRRADREEMTRREEERMRLWEQRKEEDRQAALRHDEEMDKLKSQVVQKQKMEFISTLTSAVKGVVDFFMEMGRQEVGRERLRAQQPRLTLTENSDDEY